MADGNYYDGKWDNIPTIEPPSKEQVLKWIRMAPFKESLRKKLPAIINEYNRRNKNDQIKYP